MPDVEWGTATDHYEQHVERLTGRFVPALVERCRLGEGDRLLDVGCGPGAVSLVAEAARAWPVGVDLAPAMAARFAARVASSRVLAADAQALAVATGEFDAVVSNFGVIFCPDTRSALDEMVRCARPGGVVAFTAWQVPDETSWAAFLTPEIRSEFGITRWIPQIAEWPSADALADDLRAHGLVDVEITDESHDVDISDTVDGAVAAFGCTPVTRALVHRLGANDGARLTDMMTAELERRYGSGPVPWVNAAWLASGTLIA